MFVMIGSPGQFNDDPAQAKQAMHFRKPQLALPVEANSLTLFLKLCPLKCSALPESTRHGSEDCVLGALKQDSSTGAHDP